MFSKLLPIIIISVLIIICGFSIINSEFSIISNTKKIIGENHPVQEEEFLSIEFIEKYTNYKFIEQLTLIICNIKSHIIYIYFESKVNCDFIDGIFKRINEVICTSSFVIILYR